MYVTHRTSFSLADTFGGMIEESFEVAARKFSSEEETYSGE